MTDNAPDRVEALTPRPLPTDLDLGPVPDATPAPLPVRLDLDLDAYERKPEDIIPPFVVRLGGRVISMGNPEEIDWQDLVSLTNPVQFLKYAVSKEDRTFIVSLSLPAYKLNKLMQAYQTHFKIQERVDAVQREERLRAI